MQQYELQKLQEHAEEQVKYLVFEGEGLSYRLSSLIKSMGLIEFHASNVGLELNGTARLAKFGITPDLFDTEAGNMDLVAKIQKMPWKEMHKLADEVVFWLCDSLVKSGRLQGKLVAEGKIVCL